MRRDGLIEVESWELSDGVRSDKDEVVGLLRFGANSGAKICVGGGVDK